MYQEVWFATFCQLPSQRRRVSSFDFGFKRMNISFLLLFRMTFTLTKYLDNRSSYDREFPVNVRHGLKLVLHDDTLCRYIGSARWYGIAYRAAISFRHDGTLWRTEPPYHFGTMIRYGVPSRHIISARWYAFGSMVRYSVQSHHIISARWYAIAYRATISFRHDGTL